MKWQPLLKQAYLKKVLTEKTTTTQLDLLRHGETTGGQRICGITDVPLSALGWQQMQVSVESALKNSKCWDKIYHSPLKRCAEFATQVGRRFDLPTKSIDALHEINFGSWEGLELDEVNRLYPGQWQAWLSGDEVGHGGESFQDLMHRVSKVIDTLLVESKGERILIISHGGVMRAMMAQMMGLEKKQLLRASLPHACMTRMIAYHHKGKKDWFTLDSHNFT